MQMDDECQIKLQETMQKIVNVTAVNSSEFIGAIHDRLAAKL